MVIHAGSGTAITWRLSLPLSFLPLPPPPSFNMSQEIENYKTINGDVWYLKPITFNSKQTKIITQNFNG